MLVTLAEAKDHCEAQGACAAFTFEGDDVRGPLSGNPVWVHFKTAFDCVDVPWVAWRKVRGVDSRAPGPPPDSEDSEGDSEGSRALSPFTGTGTGVALCLLGQVRMLSHTHVALEQHLLQVLQPDVFLYGPRGSEEEPAPELYSLRDYVVEERWEVESIRDNLYADTHDASRVIDLEYVQVWVSQDDGPSFSNCQESKPWFYAAHAIALTLRSNLVFLRSFFFHMLHFAT